MHANFHLNPLSKAPPNQHGESDTYLISSLATIQLRAWLTSPLYQHIYYADSSTHPGIVDSMITRHKNSLLNEPTCHLISLLHCEEPEVGEPWKVIAFIKYHVFASVEQIERRTDAGKRQWPEGMHVDMVEDVWTRIAECRHRYGKQLGPHVDVEILATDPDYQRMGAGRMLLDAVCAQADRLGLPGYLEGSEEGKKLYESCEFVGEENIWVDLRRWEDGKDRGKDWRGEGAKEGVGEGWYNQQVMLRPAKRN